MKIFASLFILLTFFGCDQHGEGQLTQFVAYSWSQVSAEYSNIVPFYWLKAEEFENPDQFVIKAKTATDKMPSGHRVMFSWDIHRSMTYQKNGDFLYTKYGEIAGCSSEEGFKPYRSLWWDNGVKSVQQQFERFFKAYAEIGGELDVFVLDFEQGFSYWHLIGLADNNYSCGLNDYLDAIQSDSRFTQWKEKLGFKDLKTINKWYENDNHLKWSAQMGKHLASYIDTAVYQPLKKYFPDAEFSNYGYYYQNSNLNLPDRHGYYEHRYTEGIHVGTHQSREIYGWVDLPLQIKLKDASYPSTPFNAFRFALNKLRAMLLSSSVPVSPWVAYKGFNNSHLKDNDYYQELILHMMLSGVDYLLYWNPSQLSDYSPDNDQLLNELIEQVNNLINNRKITFKTTELVHWLDDIVLTKVQFNDNQELWRVTANLDANQKIADAVININPAKLKIAGSVLNFNDMKILQVEQNYSDKGVWLISNSSN